MNKRIVVFAILALLVTSTCKRPNKPPDIPAAPTGPVFGHVESLLTFSALANDPDGDSVAIRFGWGDGDTSGWSPFFASGDSIVVTHAWSRVGDFVVTVEAKDAHEAQSGWSGQHTVIIDSFNFPCHVSATVPLNGNTTGLDCAPDGKHVYVAVHRGELDGSVVSVRTEEDMVVDSGSVNSYPGDVCVRPDGQYLYVGCTPYEGPPCYLYAIRTSDMAGTGMIELEDVCPHIAAMPNGSRIYVAALDATYRVLTSDFRVTDSIPFPGEAIAVAPNGDHAYIAERFRDEVYVTRTSDDVVVDTIAVPDGAWRLVLSPDGQTMYAVGAKLWTISTATKAVTDSLDIVSNGLAAMPGGKYLYVGGNPITVVRTGDMTPVASIPVPFCADDITVLPDGSAVYAIGWGESSVIVIDH